VDAVTLNAVCMPSDEVVTRDIDGNTLIIPIFAGVVEVEGELFALNETGRAIWQKLDGRRTLKEVAALVADDFAAPAGEVESEVVTFAEELRGRRLLSVRAPSSKDHS